MNAMYFRPNAFKTCNGRPKSSFLDIGEHDSHTGFRERTNCQSIPRGQDLCILLRGDATRSGFAKSEARPLPHTGNLPHRNIGTLRDIFVRHRHRQDGFTLEISARLDAVSQTGDLGIVV